GASNRMGGPAGARARTLPGDAPPPGGIPPPPPPPPRSLGAPPAPATMACSLALSAGKTLREPVSCSTWQLRNRTTRPPKTSLPPTRRPCVRVRVAADACSSSKFSRAVVPPDTAQRRQSGTCGSTPHDLCPPAASSKTLSPVSLVLDRPR